VLSIALCPNGGEQGGGSKTPQPLVGWRSLRTQREQKSCSLNLGSKHGCRTNDWSCWNNAYRLALPGNLHWEITYATARCCPRR
jgi:hypothetical protein